MTSTKPLVLVFGATGQTGGSIVRGLIASGNFRVAAAIRESSLTKPTTESLRASGYVEIRSGDLTDNIDNLKVTLEGVDVLISAVSGWLINSQKNLFLAAKAVGVGRVVPCDFGTPGAKGVRGLHDMKLAIREFIQELELPHTFIDVGWWMQLFLPMRPRSPLPQMFKEISWTIIEDRSPLVLVTNSEHIGTFVALIVADHRTLNGAVIVWEDEVTVNEAHKIGERISGEGDELEASRVHYQSDEFIKLIEAAREKLKENPDDIEAKFKVHRGEYLQSMFVLGENTLVNAKQLGREGTLSRYYARMFGRVCKELLFRR